MENYGSTPTIKASNLYQAVTMMESVVYLGLFSILFLALMQFYFTIGRSNQRSTASLLIQRSRIFLAEHTEETIRDSIAFDDSNSTVESDNSIVRFTMNSGYKEYYLEDETLMVRNAYYEYALTPPSISVTKFRAEISEDSGSNMYYIELMIDLENADIPAVSQDINFFYISS